MDDDRRTPAPRILFYCWNGSGLGHLRLTLAVAHECARRRPDAALLALTPSFETHAFSLPPTFDYVKLPNAGRWDGYFPAGRGAEPGRPSLNPVWPLRMSIIQEVADAFAPTRFLADHSPNGNRNELLPMLTSLREQAGVELCVGIRDIVDGPEVTRTFWRREGIYDLLEQTYDRILVYGSRDVFDPIVEYGLSDRIATKTVFCGYVRHAPPPAPPAHVRARLGVDPDTPFVVVSVGGGS
jgi:predicted glycosyltransferase